MLEEEATVLANIPTPDLALQSVPAIAEVARTVIKVAIVSLAIVILNSLVTSGIPILNALHVPGSVF